MSMLSTLELTHIGINFEYYGGLLYVLLAIKIFPPQNFQELVSIIAIVREHYNTGCSGLSCKGIQQVPQRALQYVVKVRLY